MLLRAFRWTAPLTTALFVYGCVSVATDPPAWTNQTIAYEQVGVTAVVSGSGRNLIQAESDLHRTLRAVVAQVLGDSIARVGGEPDSEALDRIVHRRLAHLGNRGLVILDTYTTRRSGTVQRYALIRYEMLALQQDVTALGGGDRVAAVNDMDYIQRVNAVRVVQAAFGLMSPPPNSDQITHAATRVQVTLDGIESAIQVGESRRLQLRLAVGEIPIEGLPFVLTMVGPSVDGQVQRVELRSTGDPRGVVAFTLPPIARVGDHRLSILPRVSASGAAPESLIALMSVRTTLRATSQAASSPTAVLVQQVDLAGNLLDDQTATQAVHRELASRGFPLVDARVDRAVRERLLRAAPQSSLELYDILPFDVLSAANRVVVATMRIDAFQESDHVSVAVGVAARAYDLRTNRRLPATAFDVRTAGSDGAATLTVAFQEAGRRLATRMATELP